MRPIIKSNKLDSVCYDIRGPVHKEARRLEDEGHRILKLNIGNPAPFGFEAPEEIVRDVILNLPSAQGYCESKGLFSARKAIVQHYQSQGIFGVDIEDIYIGNGVSELIVMAMQGLLNTDDEVLVPSPDYPLWTAAVNLAGGKARHYRCDESADWFPDLEDIKSKIGPRTRGIVIINPNNPTGAVYSRELLLEIVELCRQHSIILFADEIYDKILYDGAVHIPACSLSDDILTVTFNGLSKAYRAAGFRVGWMMLSGNLKAAHSYIEGLEMLSSMRLCANVPNQHAIQTALGGYQSINELTAIDGRLTQQRDICYELLNQIPGVSVVKPKGAMYAFPRLDSKRFGLRDDERLVLDLLKEKKILLVQGTAFNWPEPDHLRVVFLPHKEDLQRALLAFGDFLEYYRQ
ncbi:MULTISPECIES: pyridoxal phosphate-dependent aminotransferase [Shewanella]|jgi:alanine-synthesizing transaminase|uniref:Glutamate-pyruvate aminotransferase AlaA n=1 Tax=Shewanella chilikensis TaxID=558541 RepID=A0A6G7LSD9_9GAMM|nr:MULTISPECIES: pyridoxal phosphate-dependent aminotransferase [Shewanella]MBZ4679931.1 aminotransferase [Shewanella sp.]MCE9851249.1 pyridoxal phosphate-dependent aminotransferase [Shewanella chilikensis]MCL1153020.1 pyridoxal phosphate-dependent aminotransferase [Shewanella chilikensis]MCL1161519.1 pyridoxal phosphate-dependent aminotransferase [Shewanella chilikensis]PYE55526.1 alanine-synthesizing transaminase [Shewanella chilikensis]